MEYFDNDVCVICNKNLVASSNTNMCASCWSPNDEKKFKKTVPQNDLWDKDTFELMFSEVA